MAKGTHRTYIYSHF